MTIAEMNEVIQSFCKKRTEHECVKSCAIKEICEQISGNFSGNEKECAEAYEIICGLNNVPSDTVNHPSHYNQGKYECIDVMVETFGKEAAMNFCLLNAFKYVWRTGEKNGAEDVKKADWYLHKFLELEGKKDD